MYRDEDRRADIDARKAYLADTGRLNGGKWYWIRRGKYAAELTPEPWAERMQDSLDREQPGVTRYAPGKVLDTYAGRVLVGHAGEGRTEWVPAPDVVRQLEPAEMSQHLRAEPVHRDWSGPEMVPAGYYEERLAGY